MKYEELLDLARAAYEVPVARDILSVIAMLRSLGFSSLDWNQFRSNLVDEFVDESLVVGAFSLRDPEKLRSKATEEERENFAVDASEEFDPFEYGPESAAWTLLAHELETLQSVVVLIERDSDSPDAAGNFRVYGGAQWLRESLWAATGVLPRDPGSPSRDSQLFREAFSIFGREEFAPAPLA